MEDLREAKFATARVESKLAKASKDVDSLEKEKDDLATQVSGLEESNSESEEQLKAYSAQVALLMKQKELMETKMELVEQKHSANKAFHDGSSDQIQSLLNEKTSFLAQIASLQSSRAYLAGQLAEAEETIMELKGEDESSRDADSAQPVTTEDAIMELPGGDEPLDTSDTVASQLDEPLPSPELQVSSSEADSALETETIVSHDSVEVEMKDMTAEDENETKSESDSAPIVSENAPAVEDTAALPDVEASESSSEASISEDLPDGETADSFPEVEFRFVDMPGLSPSMKDGTVVSWLKQEGEAVAAGEALMVIKSEAGDKDIIGIGEDGFLAATIVAAGGSCEVGSPIALIATNEEDIPTLRKYASSLPGSAVAPDGSTTSETVPFFLSAPFNADSDEEQTPPIVTSIDDEDEAPAAKTNERIPFVGKRELSEVPEEIAQSDDDAGGKLT